MSAPQRPGICRTPGCYRSNFGIGLERCCAGCANPSRDGVVIHTESCKARASAEGEEIARQCSAPRICTRPGCGRASQGSSATVVGTYCCDRCYLAAKNLRGIVHHDACDERAAEELMRQARARLLAATPVFPYKPARRHLATIRVSQERLRALLDIPSNWQIVNVGYDAFRGTIEVMFSGDDLYPVADGCAAPVIAATYNLPDLQQELYKDGNPL